MYFRLINTTVKVLKLLNQYLNLNFQNSIINAETSK